MSRALVLILLVAGCSNTPSGTSDNLQQLARFHAQWEGLHITDYRVRIRYDCFCGNVHTRAIDVTVRQGQITAASYADTHAPVEAEKISQVQGIQGVFDYAREALGRSPSRVNLTFDPTYFFPSQAHFDFVSSADDDDVSFSVTAFAILQ